MTIKLLFQAITKFIFGFILVGLLIFLPAGTISFFNGWLFMVLLFVPMFFAGIVVNILFMAGFTFADWMPRKSAKNKVLL